jgi:predicted SAM-dependent methyltransferase
LTAVTSNGDPYHPVILLAIFSQSSKSKCLSWDLFFGQMDRDLMTALAFLVNSWMFALKLGYRGIAEVFEAAMKEFLKLITTRPFRAELRAMAREFGIMVSHWRGVRRARSVKLPCALHIGCGENAKPGWVNVDFNGAADLSLDVREPLPFPDDSITMIYSEHFFEHLSVEDGARFLRECARVLLPAGRLSIGVPDAALILRDYGDREKWRRTRDRYHPAECTTPMRSVNHFFRQGGEHKFAYDEETLGEAMVAAGFVDVKRRQWDAALDLSERRDGTLYIDAWKK